MRPKNRTAKQIKEARLVFVAKAQMRGLTIRQTADFVQQEMKLDKPPALGTILKDRDSLLKEWQEERLKDTDELVTLELARIDEAIFELWKAWEKSKTDFTAKTNKRKGEIDKGKKGVPRPGEAPKVNIKELQEDTKEVIMFGDPRYLTEIRMQQAERRKLLGLYAPEKKELTGKDGKELGANVTFISADSLTDEQLAEYLENQYKGR